MFKLKNKVNELIAHVSNKETEVDLKLRSLKKITDMLDEDISAIEGTLEKHNKNIEKLMKEVKNYQNRKSLKHRRNLKTKDLLKGYDFKKDYYTPGELAKITGVHYTTVMRMIHDGRLKTKKAGKYYLIPVKE